MPTARAGLTVLRNLNAAVHGKLRELANQRHRFGYRRLHTLQCWEGIMINGKRAQRLYEEKRLAFALLQRCMGPVATKAPAPVLARPNQRWVVDLVPDQMV